eukprot:scaffold11881_cov52-Phaeocystis_antarctica.AAC.4
MPKRKGKSTMANTPGLISRYLGTPASSAGASVAPVGVRVGARVGFGGRARARVRVGASPNPTLRHLGRLEHVEYRLGLAARAYGGAAQRCAHLSQPACGDPTLRHEDLATDVEVEQVERAERRLLAADRVPPVRPLLRDPLQHVPPVLARRLEHQIHL